MKNKSVDLWNHVKKPQTLRRCMDKRQQRAFSRITAFVSKLSIFFRHTVVWDTLKMAWRFLSALCFPLTQLCRQLTYVSHMHHRCQCGSFNYSICALAEAENPAKAILVFSFGEHICLRGPCGSVMANAWRPCGQGLGHVRSFTPFPNDSLIVLTAMPDSCSSATLGNMSTPFWDNDTPLLKQHCWDIKPHNPLTLTLPTTTTPFCSHIDMPRRISVTVSSIH